MNGTRPTRKPPPGARLDYNNPLASGLIGCWLLNEGGGGPCDLARGFTGTLGASAWGHSSSGPVLTHDATSDRTSLAANSSLVLPTAAACTVMLGYRKRDATLRASSAFGVNDTGARLGAHLPFSDGVVYWDYGGSTSGSTRLSVAGLTFGADTWAFTVGPRGMEIWQNAVRRASNAATPTRLATTQALFLGDYASQGSDLADFSFFYLWHRQLSAAEIAAVTNNPYVLTRQSGRYFGQAITFKPYWAVNATTIAA